MEKVQQIVVRCEPDAYRQFVDDLHVTPVPNAAMRTLDASLHRVTYDAAAVRIEIHAAAPEVRDIANALAAEYANVEVSLE